MSRSDKGRFSQGRELTLPPQAMAAHRQPKHAAVNCWLTGAGAGPLPCLEGSLQGIPGRGCWKNPSSQPPEEGPSPTLASA